MVLLSVAINVIIKLCLIGCDKCLEEVMEQNKPTLDDKDFLRLQNVLARVVGRYFWLAFTEKQPEIQYADKVNEATLDANKAFAFHVEELLDDVFDIIVEDIAYEHDIGRTQEQLNELEEGKTLSNTS